MAFLEVHMVQVKEILRRNHAGPLPARQTATAERLAGREERLARWLQEERLQLTRVHELLVRDGVSVSYSSLRRYVRETGLGKPAPATLRMANWPPGEVAEMDFGRLGSIIDAESGKKYTVWALLIVLPYSRHCFAWPLLQQTLAESIAGLEAAWQFFGGVPRRLIINLAATAYMCVAMASLHRQGLMAWPSPQFRNERIVGIVFLRHRRVT